MSRLLSRTLASLLSVLLAAGPLAAQVRLPPAPVLPAAAVPFAAPGLPSVTLPGALEAPAAPLALPEPSAAPALSAPAAPLALPEPPAALQLPPPSPELLPLSDPSPEAAARAAAVWDGSRPRADEDPWTPPETWDQPLAPEAGAPSSLAETSLEPGGRRYHPSPSDWRDEVVYSAVTDRFNRGGENRAWGRPDSGHTWHGGSLKGVEDKLDYLKGLGVTTLMLTSVMMGAPGGYHGYWPVHLMAIDPHYGTLADYKRLVDEAHKRGMKVVFDLVLNHVGKVFEYKDGNPEFRGTEPRDVRWLRDFKPSELKQEKHFYRRGAISDWNDPDQSIHGDFPPDLRHFNAENPETREHLLKVAKWWIKETDVDGFRLDAYKHMHPSFWDRFCPEVRAYAASLGKANFLILGEISTGSNAELGAQLGSGRLDAAFGYPSYRSDNAALHGLAPTQRLEEGWAAASSQLGSWAQRLVRFIDNHDVYRFLRGSTQAGLLGPAFAYLLFAPGVPMLYYGTEQAFRQAVETMDPEGPALPADPRNREDMFEGGAYKSPSSAGDKFDEGSWSFRLFRRLAELRAALPALRRGEAWVRWSDPAGAGLFAFSRVHEGREVVVLLNTSAEPKSAELWVDGSATPAGSLLEDRLHPDWRTLSFQPPGGGSKILATVPPFGVRVLTKAP